MVTETRLLEIRANHKKHLAKLRAVWQAHVRPPSWPWVKHLRSQSRYLPNVCQKEGKR